jgi:uncharacterized protein (TIGR03435 family)
MRTLLPCLLLLHACAALAQSADAPLAFEVASIKPSVPPHTSGWGTCNGGPGSKDPGQIVCNGAALKTLVTRAFGVQAFLISGPSWLDSERYSITAKVPAGTTVEQARAMWQNLLATRFRMQAHKETRDVPIYELSVGKSAPKIKDAAPELPAEEGAPAAAPGPSGQLQRGPDGFPIAPTPRGHFGAQIFFDNNGRTKLLVRNETMEHFAMMLVPLVQRTVVDKTALKGAYDFILIFAKDGPTVDAENDLPSLSAAVQEQLGLRLEAKKGPADVVVVDRIERTPTEN